MTTTETCYTAPRDTAIPILWEIVRIVHISLGVARSIPSCERRTGRCTHRNARSRGGGAVSPKASPEPHRPTIPVSLVFEGRVWEALYVGDPVAPTTTTVATTTTSTKTTTTITVLQNHRMQDA